MSQSSRSYEDHIELEQQDESKYYDDSLELGYQEQECGLELVHAIELINSIGLRVVSQNIVKNIRESVI